MTLRATREKLLKLTIAKKLLRTKQIIANSMYGSEILICILHCLKQLEGNTIEEDNEYQIILYF